MLLLGEVNRSPNESARRHGRAVAVTIESTGSAIAAVEAIHAEGDVRVGVNIVRRSLEEPARQIAVNAGEEGSVIVKQLLSTSGNSGFNAATGKFEDL